MADLKPIFDSSRLVIDNLITVTLTRPLSVGAGPEESVEVCHVQEQHESQSEVDSPMGVSFDSVTRTFHLWFVECGGLIPGRDWLIEHLDGTVYRITEVEPLAHGRRFRCKCVRKQSGH